MTSNVYIEQTSSWGWLEKAMAARYTYVLTVNLKKHPEIPKIMEEWSKSNGPLSSKVWTAVEQAYLNKKEEAL